MVAKYLVAVDGSSHGWKALDLAVDLAAQRHAGLVILHVVRHEPVPDGLERFAEVEGIRKDELAARYEAGGRMGAGILREAEIRARSAKIDGVESRTEEGDPASQIALVARQVHAEMIFIGSRGLNDAAGLLMGSVSHKVLHLARCTCVAVR
ncbi:universal stress protein [Oceanibacterium hippocampi]|uniref:Putative universal stress protein n=1 Tax=Oceanibacterium hippocampi TaxID=745714 RepID=A0A1Y5TLF8_9PROT|nr:universal stress protein [Oceanibacterium hippocampi]SLN63005.1 Putative universal stress protein [Oceanibacterium hippocampi]